MADKPAEPDPGKNGHNGRSARGKNGRQDQDPENGRFLPGNRAASGHRGPRHRRAFGGAISEKMMESLALVVMDMAMSGDIQAMALACRHLVGKPADETSAGDESEPQLEYL